MWQQSWRHETVNTITAPEDDTKTVFFPSLIVILLSNVYLNVILPSALSFSILQVDIPGHSNLTKV